MCDCTNETGYMNKQALLKWLNVSTSEINRKKGRLNTGPSSYIFITNLNRNNHPLFTNYQRRKQIKEWRQSQAKANTPRKPTKSPGNGANTKKAKAKPSKTKQRLLKSFVRK